MSKYKTTKKTIKEGYNKILCIGNGNLQYMLRYIDPFAYSTRAEGWACDYYNINGTILCDGYAPIGKNVSYDLMKKYDNRAREIRNLYLPYEEEKEKLNELLNQFMKEV